MLEKIFNIMLDERPMDWNGYPIASDFRAGIQISQIFYDGELSEEEKIYEICNLLFTGIVPGSIEEIAGTIQWYLNGWNMDKSSKNESKARSMDFDIDQWRIYSAFLAQYKINLNKADLHWWEFMSLLVNLEECAFTRVLGIRIKKINSKMSHEEKKALSEAKKIYSLEETDVLQDQKDAVKRQEAIDGFNKLRKGTV